MPQPAIDRHLVNARPLGYLADGDRVAAFAEEGPHRLVGLLAGPSRTPPGANSTMLHLGHARRLAQILMQIELR